VCFQYLPAYLDVGFLREVMWYSLLETIPESEYKIRSKLVVFELTE